MESLDRVIGEVFSLVNIDVYSPVGVLKGDELLVGALREGAVNLYRFTRDGELVKLNSAPVSMVSEPYYGADRVVFARDVAHGKELHLPYVVWVDEPGVERPLADNLEPMRIFNIIDKNDRIYLTGVTTEGIKIFEAKIGDKAHPIAKIPGMGFLGDVYEREGAGLFIDITGDYRLFTINLDTGEFKLHDTPGNLISLAYSPQGDLLIAVETENDARLYMRTRDSTEFTEYKLPYKDLEEYKPTKISVKYTPDREILAIAGREGRTRIFLEGKLIPGPEGTYGAANKYRDGIVASFTNLRTPPLVIFLDGSREGKKILAGNMPESVRNALGSVGFHWISSIDGERIPVLTLESKRAGRPGPTVVLVHGGPFSEDTDSWDIFASTLVLLGYNVVMTNYRGSTGYGSRWRKLIVGDPCGMELEDIVAAARWSIENKLASFTVIMGYSYGGYMTMCALTRKPGLFKAGVAGASVVDWEEMYNLSDPAFKMFIELMFAGNKSKWRERSPISYVENLKEPLCIIHPENDSRTPLKPVLHFMERAVELGKRFEAHIAPDMGHAINTVDDIVKILLPAVPFLYRIRLEGKQ